MSSWKLASADRFMAIELDAGDNGSLNGTFTCAGKTYPVSGGWSASGSLPGRNYSVFSFSGRTQTLPDVPDWVAVVGVMTGPGNAPQSIQLQATVSSSANGTVQQYNGTLSGSRPLTDFSGLYTTSIEALGMHNPNLSPLAIYGDGSVYISDTQVGAQFDGFSKVTLPAFNINGMDILMGELDLIQEGDSMRFMGNLTFRDTPWMTRPYLGNSIYSFPKPSLENSVDATQAFDTGDQFKLQAPNDKWLTTVGNVITASATAKPDEWLQITALDSGIVIGSGNQFWRVGSDATVQAIADTINQATIFKPLITLDGVLVLQSTDNGRYVSLRDDGALIIGAGRSLDTVAQFQGEVETPGAATLMARWGVRDTSAMVTPCEMDMANFCWQITGGLFLALGLGPMMAGVTSPDKTGIMGILRRIPSVWSKVTEAQQLIANNQVKTALFAATVAGHVLLEAWNAGVFWKVLKFALWQAGYKVGFWGLFTFFTWLLAPEAEVAELLASFAVWSAGVIATAVAISHDCGQSFLPAATPAA